MDNSLRPSGSPQRRFGRKCRQAEGAAFVASGLIVGLALGANQITPAVIEQVNQNDSPSIDLLLVNSVNPIQWTGSNKFTLDYASLNVSLQLGGNPNFV